MSTSHITHIHISHIRPSANGSIFFSRLTFHNRASFFSFLIRATTKKTSAAVKAKVEQYKQMKSRKKKWIEYLPLHGVLTENYNVWSMVYGVWCVVETRCVLSATHPARSHIARPADKVILLQKPSDIIIWNVAEVMPRECDCPIPIYMCSICDVLCGSLVTW